MRRFKSECHILALKSVPFTLTDSAKFSTNSHETDNSVHLGNALFDIPEVPCLTITAVPFLTYTGSPLFNIRMCLLTENIVLFHFPVLFDIQ